MSGLEEISPPALDSQEEDGKLESMDGESEIDYDEPLRGRYVFYR